MGNILFINIEMVAKIHKLVFESQWAHKSDSVVCEWVSLLPMVCIMMGSSYDSFNCIDNIEK